ncbi:MAG: hypothetical protein QW820_06690 [Sulfolobales archaeon]
MGGRHRFTPDGLERIRSRYYEAWDAISSKYDTGVLMVLSVDPRDYGSLWEASQGIYKAFHRFKSWLRKRLGFSPPHVSALMFQDNGSPYIQVVFFGIDLKSVPADVYEELRRAGFRGPNKMYEIVRVGEKWAWVGERPSDAKYLDPREYLARYIARAINVIRSNVIRRYVRGSIDNMDVEDMKIAMYWATGKRFFTRSKL